MDEDAFMEWRDENFEELVALFFEANQHVANAFFEYCEEEYNNREADKAEFWADLQREEELMRDGNKDQ